MKSDGNPSHALCEADTELVNRLHASPNVEPRARGRRPSLLLLHYTGMPSAAAAIGWLADPRSKVSCHYVVDEEGAITQLVPEALRAWHAGVARWAGETDINSISIGIEVQNPGHAAGYPDFAPEQMRRVAALAGDIVSRWSIAPERVLAHSDVAPMRKMDPGEKFDWAGLAAVGVGHFVKPEPPAPRDRGLQLGDAGPAIAEVQGLLARYGYGVEAHGDFDERTHAVVTAFQRHFRPERVDGRIDQSTITTLERLIAGLASS
jgi:N-acetylmuramoyl-L-alanine amidase